MRFEIRHVNDIEQRYFWHLVTDQGRILGWSENYRTKDECLEAIASLRAGVPSADVVDLTGSAERR